MSAEHPNAELLRRAKAGDPAALNELCDRLIDPLTHWASGRLPPRARTLLDTDDLVQETVIRALQRIEEFEIRHEAAFEAYLQRGLMNRIRDEIRRANVRPERVSSDDHDLGADGSPSAIDELIGRETQDLYEEALRSLKPADREAIVARVDLQLDFESAARLLGKPSPDAARVAINRALTRLAEAMAKRARSRRS